LKLNGNIVKDNGQKKTYNLDPVTNFGQVIDLGQVNKEKSSKPLKKQNGCQLQV
jgi:hypothetical protein